MKLVVHVQLFSILSGVQNVSLCELKGLKEDLAAQYDVGLIVKNDGPLVDEIRKITNNIYYCDTLCREISPKLDFLSLIKMVKIFKDVKPYIVHTHSSKTGFIGRIAAKISGVPRVIHTVHGFPFPASESRLRKLIYFLLEFIAARFSDAIVVMNKNDYNVAKNFLLVSKKKIHFIPNGIDDGRFRLHESCTTSLDSGIKKIVMVGRLSEQKNPICLLEAFNIIVKKYEKKVNLTFIGDGDLRDGLERTVEQYGLSECVFFQGWSDSVQTILNTMDIFVLPSNWEGMPLAIIEAMFTSMPIVVSNIPGNVDLINHGNNGLIFDKNNFHDLASKILYLIDNPKKAFVMGRQAQLDAHNKYTLKEHNKKIENLYSTV